MSTDHLHSEIINKHFLLRNCFLSHHPRLVWDQISSPGDPSAMGREPALDQAAQGTEVHGRFL